MTKVTGDSAVFNLTASAPASNATTAAFASKRMVKPNTLTTLDLEMAIDSGKTLIGQLDDSTSKNVTQGESRCRDDKNKDYWAYQVFISKESNQSNFQIDTMRPLKECLPESQFRNKQDFIGINLSEEIINHETLTPKIQS